VLQLVAPTSFRLRLQIQILPCDANVHRLRASVEQDSSISSTTKRSCRTKQQQKNETIQFPVSLAVNLICPIAVPSVCPEHVWGSVTGKRSYSCCARTKPPAKTLPSGSRQRAFQVGKHTSPQLPARVASVANLQENAILFMSVPYVCPEPVLVK
jgi:hypothetical protein